MKKLKLPQKILKFKTKNWIFKNYEIKPYVCFQLLAMP